MGYCKPGNPIAAAVKVGLHAVVGGAVSVAQGGSFETGALTGAVAAGSSLLMDSSGLMGHSGDGVPENVAARTAVAAVAGGTASVLSAGKFANGAITGAFAQLYNADWTSTEPPPGTSITLFPCIQCIATTHFSRNWEAGAGQIRLCALSG
ncbi:MAG: hypothetical protein R3D51_17920 [Hyphomicrobiaceae bacterium]